MAELRKAWAGVDNTTGLRRAPNRGHQVLRRHFDWLFLASDLVVIFLVKCLADGALRVFNGRSATLDVSAATMLASVLDDPGRTLVVAVFAALSVWYFWLKGHYGRRRSSWDALGDVAFIALCLAGVEIFFSQTGANSFFVLFIVLGSWGLAAACLLAGRAVIRHVMLQKGAWLHPAIIIGKGDRARALARVVAGDSDLGLRVTHIVEPRLHGEKEKKETSCQDEPSDISIRVISSSDPLADLILRFRGHVVLLCPEPGEYAAVSRMISKITPVCSSVGLVLPPLGFLSCGLRVQRLLRQDTALLWVRNRLAEPVWRFTKRAFDIFGSLVLLAVFAPVIGLAALAVVCTDGRPVFYRQERVGRGGLSFPMYKFRSMVNNAEGMLKEWQAVNPELWATSQANNFKLHDDPRVTQVGKWLRRLSIDELPQLWNVLKGDMSLVGPRPLLSRELGDYGESIEYYLSTRPGISGLWQVSGRSNSTFSDRASSDAWYVRNWSLWYDMVILLQTLRVVFSGRGAY